MLYAGDYRIITAIAGECWSAEFRGGGTSTPWDPPDPPPACFTPGLADLMRLRCRLPTSIVRARCRRGAWPLNRGGQRSIVSRTHNSLPTGAREGNLVQYS
jgi:hypothetical protein